MIQFKDIKKKNIFYIYQYFGSTLNKLWISKIHLNNASEFEANIFIEKTFIDGHP